MAVPTYVTHVGFGHTVDEEAYKMLGSTAGWTLVSSTPNYIEGVHTRIVFNTSRTFTPLTNVWISCSLLRQLGR